MQWFKNLTVYRLPANYALSAEALAVHLAKCVLIECGSHETQAEGFVAPVEGGGLVHCVNKQLLMKFVISKRLLPTSVINQVVKARAAELEEQQGFAPGRKALKDLKERITDELLPRAFVISTPTQVWIDPVNGWLVMDTSSPNKADEILKQLLKCIPTFPVESLRVNHSPITAMTDWLVANEAPTGFTIDQDAELRAHTEDKATVRYVNQTLEAEDTQRHIAAGKQCSKLAMTWNSKISFVLGDSLAIKRIKALDILDEETQKSNNAQERFDADFILMTAEIAAMLDDIIYALGGEIDEQKDLVNETSKVAA